jgi:hypothetical protein
MCEKPRWSDESVASMLIIFLFVWLIMECIGAYRSIGGDSYLTTRKQFFLVLILSICCAIPRYAWCFIHANEEGVENCLGTGVGYTIVYSVYSVAISGFSVCLGIAVCVFDSLYRKGANGELKLLTFEYENYQNMPKFILHCCVAVNVAYLVVTFGFFVSMNNNVFYSRFDAVSTIVYAVYQVVLLVSWWVVGCRMQSSVSYFGEIHSMFTNFRQRLSGYPSSPERQQTNQFSNRILFLNFVILFSIAVNLPREGFLLYTLKKNAYVNYFLFALFTVVLPFFVGNHLLVKLMAWSAGDESPPPARFSDDSYKSTFSDSSPSTSRSASRYNGRSFDNALLSSVVNGPSIV